jgi:ribonuclease R
VTVEVQLSEDSVSRSTSYHRSLIRSDARLTYRQVESAFRGEARLPVEVAEPVAQARRLAATLRNRRLQRGALGIESSEPEFDFDPEGHVVSAIDDVQTESHTVIEELMIFTNELVAGELGGRRKPTLYRVHEQPEPEAIERLVAQLESLDVPTPPIPDHIGPQAAGELVSALGESVMAHVRRTGHGGPALTSLVLRALKQAYYSPANVGHAGLASAAYCHFTSPIRRYPDLVVHRGLLAAVGAGEEEPLASELADVASHCSATEREAMAIERDADDICIAFLADHFLHEEGPDRVVEGEIGGLISAGAFVSFTFGGQGAAACEGFLPVRHMRDDYFELNELGTALVGRRTDSRLRLGDPVSVMVRSIDPPRGRIDLAPAAHKGPERRGRRRSGARR